MARGNRNGVPTNKGRRTPDTPFHGTIGRMVSRRHPTYPPLTLIFELIRTYLAVWMVCFLLFFSLCVPPHLTHSHAADNFKNQPTKRRQPKTPQPASAHIQRGEKGRDGIYITNKVWFLFISLVCTCWCDRFSSLHGCRQSPVSQ